MEPATYEGHWWLPGEYDDRVGGVLTYDSDSGIELRIFDRFDTPSLQTSTGSPFYDRVYGQTGNDDRITLLGCSRTSFSGQTSSAVATESYQARHLLTDIHYEQNKNIAFGKLSVKFSLLKDWSGVADPPMLADQNKWFREGGPSPGETVGIKMDVPERFELSLMPFDIKLVTPVTHHLDRLGTGSIDSESRFVIDFRRPSVPLSACLDHVTMLRDLLTLASDRRVQPRSIVGVRSEQRQRSNEGGTEIRHSLLDAPSDTDSLHPSRYNFRLSEIPDGFDGLMRRWYELYQTQETAIHTYLSSKYNTAMYQENKFMSLVQAVEAYHRRRYRDEDLYMKQANYDPIREALMDFIRGNMSNVYSEETMLQDADPASISVDELLNLTDGLGLDSDLGNSLKGAIEHGNEYSLRTRLKILINDRYYSILKDIPHSPTGNVHPIVETRNSLAHQLEEEDQDPAVAEGDDMTRLSWGLEQLLAVAFLSDLGIPESQIKTRLTKRYEQYHIVS